MQVRRQNHVGLINEREETMELIFFLFIFILVICLIFCLLKLAIHLGRLKQKNSFESIKASRLLTEREKKLFFQLSKAFPPDKHVILTQVAFSALIWAPKQAVRAKFNRKRTDFVLTDNNFRVLTIIELDDNSHNGRDDEDVKRDAMLNQAGYLVVRFRKLPTESELIAMKNSLLSCK